MTKTPAVRIKTPAVRIRPFREGELPALQDIRARAFAPVFASFRDLLGPDVAAIALADAEAGQARLLERICAADAPGEVHVAVVDGRPVGFVSVSFDRATGLGEIGLNAVDPAFSGRGIGTRLYLFALDRMRAEGMRAATVGTGGDASHAAARRAYEKAGFGPALPTVWLYRTL